MSGCLVAIAHSQILGKMSKPNLCAYNAFSASRCRAAVPWLVLMCVPRAKIARILASQGRALTHCQLIGASGGSMSRSAPSRRRGDARPPNEHFSHFPRLMRPPVNSTLCLESFSFFFLSFWLMACRPFSFFIVKSILDNN